MSEARASHTYRFHGTGLAVRGCSRTVARVHARLSSFYADIHDHCDVQFDLEPCERDEGERNSDGARSIYELTGGSVLYSRERDQVYMSLDSGVRAWCDAASGRVRMRIRAEAPNWWIASHLFFTISLIEVLKRRRVYSVHAAGLARNGRGLLLAGASGAGKSTLAILLARAGFDFLGDDMLFLQSGREGIRVLAFPDETDITSETALLFPELRHLAERAPESGSIKRQITLEEMFRTRVVSECRPAAIVFPKVVRGGSSRLIELDSSAALLELAPNVLLTEVRSSQAHLDALAKLAEMSRCYRLEAGQDFDRISDLLGGAME